MVLGSFLAAFLGAGGMSLAQMDGPLKILGVLIGIPISYVTFRAVVGKYLFPKIEEDEPPPRPNQSLQPTAGHSDD